MHPNRRLTQAEKDEIRYIHHIGGFLAREFGQQGSRTRRKTPNVVKMLETYLAWAPLRRWDADIDGHLMMYHARVRLARIKKAQNALTN